VCRIRDVYPGSRIRLFSIPDPGSELLPSRIRIKEFNYFNLRKWFLSSRKYDLGYSSRIRIPDSGTWLFTIPDPGVKKAPDPGSGSATLEGNSIQITIESVPPSELLPPPPSHKRVCVPSPPPLGSCGVATIACGGGGGGSQFRRPARGAVRTALLRPWMGGRGFGDFDFSAESGSAFCVCLLCCGSGTLGSGYV